MTMFKEKSIKGEASEIAPWSPYFGSTRLERELDRMKREFRRAPRFNFGWPEELSLERENFRLQMPAIEIYDEKDEVVVKAELPGMKKEDLEINLSGDNLTIKGEKRKREEVKEKGSYYSELSYGSFERSIEIPVKVISDKIRASFKEGILEVRLQKSEEAKRKEVKIKIE